MEPFGKRGGPFLGRKSWRDKALQAPETTVFYVRHAQKALLCPNSQAQACPGWLEGEIAMALPVTIATASALVLVYMVLLVRIGQLRFRHHISIGDGGNADLLCRMRTQANFVEYVPLLLLFMAMFEAEGVSRQELSIAGGALVVFRILHAIGMPRPAPNPFRAIGAAGTTVLLIGAAVQGLVMVVRG
jgi:uncharacterized membrane protein YecN with MAPEG domain